VPRIDTLPLDAHALQRELLAQGIEQWWVAERIGVARRTVGRWLSGEVKRISRDNLTQLARLLGCEEQRLLATDDAEVFATRADQSQAVQELLNSEAVFLAADQDSLYETMLRAVLHPGLTLYQRCVLYNRMLVSAARQGKYEAGRRYAQLALEHAAACGNHQYSRSININLGAMEAEAGNLLLAHEIVQRELNSPGADGSKQNQMVLHCNLANLQRLMGSFEDAERTIACAHQLAREIKRQTFLFELLSIEADLALERGHLDIARYALDQLFALPQKPPEPRRSSECRLRQALLHALEGRQEQALVSARAEIEWLSQFPYFAQPPQLIGGQIHRLAGQLDEARDLLLQGLQAGTTRRYEFPLLQLELARVERDAGQHEVSRRLLSQARRGLRACGMTARAAMSL
jgi:transcriptional regulator with XRE-family HTH domain